MGLKNFISPAQSPAWAQYIESVVRLEQAQAKLEWRLAPARVLTNGARRGVIHRRSWLLAELPEIPCLNCPKRHREGRNPPICGDKTWPAKPCGKFRKAAQKNTPRPTLRHAQGCGSLDWKLDCICNRAGRLEFGHPTSRATPTHRDSWLHAWI